MQRDLGPGLPPSGLQVRFCDFLSGRWLQDGLSCRLTSSLTRRFFQLLVLIDSPEALPGSPGSSLAPAHLALAVGRRWHPLHGSLLAGALALLLLSLASSNSAHRLHLTRLTLQPALPSLKEGFLPLHVTPRRKRALSGIPSSLL